MPTRRRERTRRLSSLTDKDAGPGQRRVGVTVSTTAAPTVAITFVSSPVGTGFTATLRGIASDPDQESGSWSLFVTWGDGSRGLTLIGGSPLTFTRTHTYATPGDVVVTARLTDAAGVAGTASASVIVALGVPVHVGPPPLPCPPDAKCIKRVGASSTLQVALFSAPGFQPVQFQPTRVTLGDNLSSEAVASSCANVGDQNSDGVADTRWVPKTADLRKATTTTGAQRLVLNGLLGDAPVAFRAKSRSQASNHGPLYTRRTGAPRKARDCGRIVRGARRWPVRRDG